MGSTKSLKPSSPSDFVAYGLIVPHDLKLPVKVSLSGISLFYDFEDKLNFSVYFKISPLVSLFGLDSSSLFDRKSKDRASEKASKLFDGIRRAYINHFERLFNVVPYEFTEEVSKAIREAISDKERYSSFSRKLLDYLIYGSIQAGLEGREFSVSFSLRPKGGKRDKSYQRLGDIDRSIDGLLNFLQLFSSEEFHLDKRFSYEIGREPDHPIYRDLFTEKYPLVSDLLPSSRSFLAFPFFAFSSEAEVSINPKHYPSPFGESGVTFTFSNPWKEKSDTNSFEPSNELIRMWELFEGFSRFDHFSSEFFLNVKSRLIPVLYFFPVRGQPVYESILDFIRSKKTDLSGKVDFNYGSKSRTLKMKVKEEAPPVIFPFTLGFLALTDILSLAGVQPKSPPLYNFQVSSLTVLKSLFLHERDLKSLMTANQHLFEEEVVFGSKFEEEGFSYRGRQKDPGNQDEKGTSCLEGVELYLHEDRDSEVIRFKKDFFGFLESVKRATDLARTIEDISLASVCLSGRIDYPLLRLLEDKYREFLSPSNKHSPSEIRLAGLYGLVNSDPRLRFFSEAFVGLIEDARFLSSCRLDQLSMYEWKNLKSHKKSLRSLKVSMAVDTGFHIKLGVGIFRGVSSKFVATVDTKR